MMGGFDRSRQFPPRASSQGVGDHVGSINETENGTRAIDGGMDDEDAAGAETPADERQPTDTLDIPAVVLAAGDGTRMEPLTEHRPKPMLPVANKPLLEYVIESIVAVGITEIILVVGYRRSRIKQYVGDGSAWNVDVRYVVQEPRRGTGHALAQAESVVGGEFLALNGDRILDPSVFRDLTATHRETGDPTMAITRVDEPSHYGVVEVEDDRSVRIDEKPPAELVSSDLINAGAYVFGPEMFAAIRRTESQSELDLTAALQSQLDERPVRAVPYRDRWFDVTHPWDLLSVNGRLLADDAPAPASSSRIADAATVIDRTAIASGVEIQPGAVVQRDVALGPDVTIGPNAVVENAILFPGAHVDAACVVRDSIVGSDVRLGPNVTIEGGPADVRVGDRVHRDVPIGTVIGDYTHVGGGATLESGTVVGADAEVGPGTVVRGRVQNETRVQRG